MNNEIKNVTNVSNQAGDNVIDVSGDALCTDCDVLCHQVNLDGVMGAGIARQIAIEYPTVEKLYRKYPHKALGEVCFAKTDKYVVANCFSQTEFYDTDYNALEKCLMKVKSYMIENGLNGVAFPYKYGCGIASGRWDRVLNVIKKVFQDEKVCIYHRH